MRERAAIGSSGVGVLALPIQHLSQEKRGIGGVARSVRRTLAQRQRLVQFRGRVVEVARIQRDHALFIWIGGALRQRDHCRLQIGRGQPDQCRRLRERVRRTHGRWRAVFRRGREVDARDDRADHLAVFEHRALASLRENDRDEVLGVVLEGRHANLAVHGETNAESAGFTIVSATIASGLVCGASAMRVRPATSLGGPIAPSPLVAIWTRGSGSPRTSDTCTTSTPSAARSGVSDAAPPMQAAASAMRRSRCVTYWIFSYTAVVVVVPSPLSL